MDGCFFRECVYEVCMDLIVVWGGCVRWGGRGVCVCVGGWLGE